MGEEEIDKLRAAISRAFGYLDKIQEMRPYWGPRWETSLNDFEPLLKAVKEEIKTAYRYMADTQRSGTDKRWED